MSEKERDVWRKQRKVGSLLVFGATIFILRLVEFTPIFCVVAAALLACLYFLLISQFMKWSERGE